MNGIKVDEYNKFLREHGIDLLTSEADGTGLRGLFDLTEEGQEILGEFLGWATFNSPGWNNWDGKSAMLAWDMIRPLCIYIMMREGCKTVVHVSANEECYANYLRGYIDEDGTNVEIDRMREIYGPRNIRVYWKSGTARDGLRNQHVMSGRVE